MTDQAEGGCFCGALRYRIERRPMFIHCCHCTDCQRQTGGAFALNAMIETTALTTLSGETMVHGMPTDSGSPHWVTRCAACGTAVWSEYSRPQLRFIRVATLDDRAAFTPDVHIYTRSRLPWVTLPADTPAFAEYYDPKALWPAESQQRFRAAMKSA